ncbi:MAG: esterase family protein, partial [Caulobacterales bacterium]|nr:esterase family protein [Caulobacterales bacterium]
DDAGAWLRWTSIERYATARGLMVVLLDGERFFYTDLAIPGMNWEQHILFAVDFVDRTFPTRAVRAQRGIGGLSMGGYGAMKIGLKHPDRFASIAAHSGAYDVKGFRASQPQLAALMPTVRAGDDVYKLAVRPGPKPAIRFDCGSEDFLLDDNRRLHRLLERKGIAHVYEEHPGGHGWDYWDRHVPAALDFHCAAFTKRRKG